MPKYQVYALKYAGPLESSGALLMWLKDWDQRKKRNFYFWCIKNDSQAVIVDTGVTAAIAEELRLPNYQEPSSLLSTIGVDPITVRNVVLTHLHYDHACGIDFFPNATFWLQEEEYRFWMEDPISSLPVFQLLFRVECQETISLLTKDKRLNLLKGDHEIMPGVKCLFCPGHTPGLQAVAATTKDGTTVLGSDCAHLFENYEGKWPSDLTVNVVALMESFNKIMTHASRPDLVFPGHDPLMTTKYKSVAKNVSQIA